MNKPAGKKLKLVTAAGSAILVLLLAAAAPPDRRQGVTPTPGPDCTRSAGISTDRRVYALHAPIRVIVCGVLLGDGAVDLEQRRDGQWIALPCLDATSFALIPGGFTFTLIPAGSGVGEPFVSTPANPGEFGGSLETLPTPVPWQPGTPTREAPKGRRAVPVQGTATPGFPDLTAGYNGCEIGAGLYRIALRFPAGGAAQGIYAPAFVVLSEEGGKLR